MNAYEGPSQPTTTLTIDGIGAPWTESRRNLWTYPQPTSVGLLTDYFRWGTHTAATGTVAIDTDGWARVPAGTGTSFGMRANNFGNAGGLIAPGSYVLSLDLETSPGQSIPSILYWTYTLAGADVQSMITAAPQIQPDGRYAFPITANATAARIAIYLFAPKSSGTAWFRVRRSQLEAGIVATDYLDGSTNPDGDLKRTRWLGTPNASASVEEVRAQGDVLHPSGGTVTLDENYSPRIQASITVPLTGPEQGELIDPRTDQRCTITIGNARDAFTPPRTFDLGIRDRTVDYAQQTMTITAASDEMMLHDTRRLAKTTDRNSRDHEGSLYDLVNWVLGVIGAHLEPPLFAAPAITASWDQTNLVPNSRALVNTAGWSALVRGGAGNVVRGTTSVVLEGAPVITDVFVNVTTATTTDASARFDPTEALPIRITEGRLYTLSAYVFQNSGTGKESRVWLGFKDDAGRTIRAEFGTVIPVPHNSWTKVTVTAVAPVNCTTASFEIGVNGGMPAGKGVGVTAVVLAEGVENDRWYDGDRPDETRYVYDYTPVAGTPSTRVALNPLAPEMFAWEPGQSLFDFVRPFLEVTGTRLWCDEQRKWWLDIPRPNDLTDIIGVYGTGASIGNAVEGTDVISRDRDDYATGVVVKSTWRTANGDRKTSYDIAGDWGKVVLVERDANPGAGIAASMLAAMKNRARTQQLTITDGQQITPGAAADIRLPGTANYLAHVRRVEIDLATGNATINTTGMETP